MRQIEIEMLKAFNACKDWHKANTEVQNVFGATYVFLHGNCICVRDNKTGVIEYSCGGWHTVTTRSRLRALNCDCRIKNGRIIDNKTGREILHYFGARS